MATYQYFYYKEIQKKGSLENAVDTFWNNLLPIYFKGELDYGIEQETRVFPSKTSQRADFTIRYVKNGTPKKVILMEDKRKGYETQSAEWAEALEQLKRYVELVRMEKHQAGVTLYAAVNIGTYTRFYEFDGKTGKCKDYPLTAGELLEVAKNEAEIHAVLTEFVEKTLH